MRGLARELCQSLRRVGGHRADSGAAACRALTGGSPLGSAPPPGQQARTRRQAVPAATRPRGPRPRELTGPSSSRRAFSRRAKITVKSARCARVLRTAPRAALDSDLPRQTLAPIRRTDLPRLDRPLRLSAALTSGRVVNVAKGRTLNIDGDLDASSVSLEHDLIMQILRMRRGATPAPQLNQFEAFLQSVSKEMQPMTAPYRALLAKALNIDSIDLGWGTSNTITRFIDRENYTMAEAFLVEDGVVVIGARQTPMPRRIVRNPDGSIDHVAEPGERATVELSVFASPSADFDGILNRISNSAKEYLQVDLKDYYFRNAAFHELRRETIAEELPRTPETIAGAGTLANKELRTLAIQIKTSRGLLSKDIAKITENRASRDLVDELVEKDIASREVVVVCGVSHGQVARVPDKNSLTKLALDGLRCACGKPIDEESPEDLITISKLGVLLLDKSRWLSILVREELINLGVPATDILLECQLGSDEIDCIALVSGDIVILELKDKEFSMGNAYSFSAKISIVNPRHSVIITTEKVGPDVKSHFSRTRWDSRPTRGRSYAADAPGSLHYVEGNNFVPSLRIAVAKIYRADAQRILNEALAAALPSAESLLEAIASSQNADEGTNAEESEAPTLEDADVVEEVIPEQDASSDGE